MKTKFYWHIHHTVLVEPQTEPIKNRIAFIKIFKHKREIALRLRLLKPVRGKLPTAVTNAWKAYLKARQACNQARNDYLNTPRHHEAWDTYMDAGNARDKERDVYNEILANHREEIEALHAQECPDCPWDGYTIFPQEENE